MDIQIKDDYIVRVADVDYFTVIVGIRYPSTLTKFPAEFAADTVFEMKTSWPSGRKKWFTYPGREFYFCIPRKEIEFIKEPGYSYVPVKINGHKYNFNVSGGSHGKGWMDIVHSVVHAGVDIGKDRLVSLASVSVNPNSVQHDMAVRVMDADQQKRFDCLMAEIRCKKYFNDNPAAIAKIFLNVEYDGKYGPFEFYGIQGKRKRIGLLYKGILHARFSQIDWLRTAQENSL